MKKRTSLVCFLIFTLCVFYTAIPNTVFGQEAEPSLAEKVFEKYETTLEDPQVKLLLPSVLEALSDPATLENPIIAQLGGFDAAVDLLLGNPNLITTVVPDATPEVIALLGTEPIQTMFKDPDVRTLMQDSEAVKELAALLTAPSVQPDPAPSVQPEVSLAGKVFEKYRTTLEDPQVQLLLPGVLEALSDPATLENPIIAQLGGFDAAIDLLLGNPGLITTVVPDTPPEVVALLGTEPIQTMFKDPDVRVLLQDAEAVKELAALLAAPPVKPDPAPPVKPEPEPPVKPEPEPPPPTEKADPFDPIMPTDESLLGKSKLGGLSINKISGRKFLQDLLMTATKESRETLKSLSPEVQDLLVEGIVQLIPEQVPFTKKQIRAFLKSDNIPIFSGQIDGSLAQGLDLENFGNALTPMPIELFYPDKTDPNLKYLTRNSLNLYVRVPSVNIGGVKFSSSDGTLQPKDGVRVSDPAILGSETVRYTFRLEEALAATNLPAWPALEDNLEQLFSDVTLRYSNSGLHGEYSGHPMTADFTENGVVWEVDVDVTQGNNFYYFDVTLAIPLTLQVLDREQLEILAKETTKGNLPSISEVLNATLDPPLEIKMWSMPDPRNLQLADRGILDALFDSNFQTVFKSAADPLLAKLLSGGSLTPQEILDAVTKHRARLQTILLGNSNRITTQFESGFDPLLASVFSIPKVDPESESLWVASFDNIHDGNYFVGAVVHDADGNPLDQMWSDITVDTKAPEANVEISEGDNTAVYHNDADGIYVATNLGPGTATLKVTGIPGAGPSNYVREGYGYLLYQILGLNPDGTPYRGQSSLQRPNTWMPLTPEATMLASTVWEQTIAQLVDQGALPEELDFAGATLPTKTLNLETVLAFLGTPAGLAYIENDPTLGPALEDLGNFLDQDLLDPKVINLLVEVFGATAELINHIPITYGDPHNDVMMLAQIGEDVLAGDYGIRALGIDTLFNVSSHTAPTRLRIVDSREQLVDGTLVHFDRASVTFAVIGDCNMDGDTDDLFESGLIADGNVTIFNNTTENVMLTVTVDHRSPHPATVMVQYMDASGVWQEIDEPVGLTGYGTGDTLTIPWNVADFNELLGGNEMGEVMVRAVATNDLQLTDQNPTVGTIKLDAGICPLDPEVIAITVDPATTTNSNSGAPQGMLTLNAYTPSRTSTSIDSVRLAAKGPQDAEWTIETSEVVEDIGGQTLADLLGDLVSTVGPEKPTVNVDSTYRKWSITVDTTTLADTITAGKDENQYVVMGYVSTNGTEVAPVDGVEAKFSVDNIDGTKITAVADADGAVEANEDGSYTVGGLVDKYDEAVESPMVTFTIEPLSYPATYASVMVVTDAEGASIGEATETAEGSGVFEITVDVGILADGEYLENGTYMFHAVTVDAEGSEVPETDGAKISVNVENTRRPAPEILAITTDPAAETNPDSGAPKGIVTVNAYSIGEATSPLIDSMGFEVARQSQIDDDSAWKPVGATEEGMVVTSEEVQELQHLNADSLSDIIAVAAGTAATSSEPAPIHRYQSYQKWSLSIDTTDPELGLEDTIDKDSDAARDASLDKDPYVVRAVAFSTANDSETPSPDGVQSTFSLDNVDDVGPLGPTNIIAVADVAGPIEANEDGSYTVGGIVDDTVPSPIATFTIEQTADPITYEGGSVNLVQTTEDGTETTTEGEAGVLDTITIDVGMLENGTYMFHALTVDEFGNVQPNESPMITVHVDNIRVSDLSDPVVIAVDGTEVADAPTEPISLRESVTVSFMVANASLAAEELSGAVDGSEVPSESAEDPENTFSLMVEVGGLVDGVYTPDGVITKRNGSVAFPLTTVNVDNTGPMVMIESPTDGEAVDSLPTVHATYNDGAGSGTDKDGQEVLPWATTELADGPTVGITRLQPEQGNTDVEVDQDAIETDNGTLVYTRTEQLPGGAYRITVQVADVLGNVGSGSQEFVINGTLPTVAIHSPASGQTFDHGQPLISGEFSGAGTVEIKTLMVNGLIVEAEVEGNRFSYTPETALANGNHTVAIEVEDGDGNTAQASVTFAVEMPRDTTPPVISSVAPTGVIKDSEPGKLGAVVISAVVTDEQSAVSSVKYSVNGGQLLSISNLHINEGKIEAPVDYEAHGDGLYTVRLIATSEGGTTEHTWTFTLIVDNVAPTITSITPSGTVRGGLPVISASANDESGVAEMSIVLIDSDGEEVSGGTLDDGEDNVSGITRLDFNPEAPLEEGVYTIEVRATDPYSNSASAKGTFTVDFDTAAPIITLASPANNARLMYAEGEERRPTIAISYADAESGIDVDSIRFVFNDNLITLTPQQKSASQVTYKPAQDLEPGQYSVKLEVSDRANQEGNVSDESDGAREANMAVYQFTFSVELQDGPILAARPLNYPNPFKDNTRISFTLARQATVSIVIYDATLRPVRVLVDNQVLDAGNYTRKDNGSDAIGWDGTSSSGEDLARGIYFCEIIVADGFEPEYAILKLALTR